MNVSNASAFTNMLGYFEFPANCTGNNMVLKVLDIQGRIAKTVKQSLEQNIDKIRLNVEDLRAGIYVINIFADDRFVKSVRYTKN